MVKISDELDLIAEARSGCRCALNELATKVSTRIWPILYKMTRDYNLSHDLLQETLLVMLRSLKDLERIEGFWGWIHTIARNKVYDHFRKSGHREIVGLEDIDPVNICKLNSTNNSVLRHAVGKESRDCLVAAIGDLGERYRDVVWLRSFEEKSYTEIASVSRCTPQQARVRFFRAKQSLRNRLCAAGFETGG